MRRRLMLAAAMLLAVIPAQPVFGDDLSVRQADVKQQLAAASAQITKIDDQMAALERSVTDAQQRITRERAQVRLLARALYAQPDTLVALVIEAPSLNEALTRIANLTSAADRAAATKRALDHDVTQLAEQRSQLQADRDRERQLLNQLEDQWAKMIGMAAAPTASLGPGSTGAIQQIILDAFAALGPAAQTWALRVANCESHYNPYAVNSSSGASGLFQFLPSTWARSPYAGQSVFDPKANAQAAAWLYQRSGPGQWSCK
jgi:hypothetical protein